MAIRFRSWGLGALLVASACHLNEAPGYELGTLGVTLTPPEATAAVGSDVTFTGTLDLTGAGADADFAEPQELSIQVFTPAVLAPANDLSLSTDPKAPFTSPDRYTVYFSGNENRPFTLKLRCLSEGTSNFRMTISSARRAAQGAVGSAVCTAPPPPTKERKPREFAVGLADLLIAARVGDALDLPTSSHGVTSNLTERTPELAAKFTEIGANCERYEGATTFPSVKGPDTVTAKTDSQNATATYDTGSSTYKWAGLTSGADVFAPSNKLSFGFTDSAGAPESLSIDAPAPFTSAGTTFSAPKGLDTEFHVPDGGAQHVLLFGQLGAGAGFACDYMASALPLVNGYRVTKVVPDDVRAAIPGIATSLTTLYLAKSNAVSTAKLFPSAGERDVNAARMIRVNAAFLAPPAL